MFAIVECHCIYVHWSFDKWGSPNILVSIYASILNLKSNSREKTIFFHSYGIQSIKMPVTIKYLWIPNIFLQYKYPNKIIWHLVDAGCQISAGFCLFAGKPIWPTGTFIVILLIGSYLDYIRLFIQLQVGDILILCNLLWFQWSWGSANRIRFNTIIIVNIWLACGYKLSSRYRTEITRRVRW